MNVYKRLQSAKVALQSIKLKESGKNTFAGYSYMELGDFLPQINSLCLEHGLCGVVSFGDVATLTIVNIEKPEEKIVFESPMSTAELKGCHPVQNLGAVQSYTRRYLWIAAFDIVEHDALDSTHGQDDKKPAQKPPAGANKPPASAATADMTEKHKEYIDRIKAALKAIYGDNKEAALARVEKETAFTGKDGKPVPGKRDFTKLSEIPAKILAHTLEKESQREGDAP